MIILRIDAEICARRMYVLQQRVSKVCPIFQSGEISKRLNLLKAKWKSGGFRLIHTYFQWQICNGVVSSDMILRSEVVFSRDILTELIVNTLCYNVSSRALL